MSKTDTQNEPPVKVEIERGQGTAKANRSWISLWQRLLAGKPGTNETENHHERS
jgi:hypothetical protein